MPEKASKKVFKKVLSNGLTVLVRPTHTIPKVSTQLWYNVGSKDEKSGQKGIAHLIEHMIFKGTKKLSESDINLITHKLSGYCNAFTSYDYTGYLFDFPSQNWEEALPIMADCMQNCTFKQDLLNSEMKAVIQELKMYRDDYTSTLIEQMISDIFVGHPYTYPIIGYKHDLWSLKRDELVAFYKKHYAPNNATLVVVGDVNPEEVFKKAEKYFGHIPANPTYKKEEHYVPYEIGGKSVTLYRDIKQPFVLLSYVVPGGTAQKDYILDVLCWILGIGKASRLQKKLVHDLQLVTNLETFTYDLFDKGLFFIYFKPKDMKDVDKIIDIINKEIAALAQNGITKEELKRARKQTETQYLSVLENTQKQAYVIGQAYIATGDSDFIFNYGKETDDEIKKGLQEIVYTYMRPSLMHKGVMLPLAKKDQDLWITYQQRSDEEDKKVLTGITRQATVEPGIHVHNIDIQKPKPFDFPKPKKFTLKNGLKVFTYHNPNVPKIELIIDLKAKHFYDPENLQGLNTFMSAMLTEGTKQHSASELADLIEGNGMSFGATPGMISMNMLSPDFEKGLTLLHDILTESSFEKSSVAKIRAQLIAALNSFWDTPPKFCNQLARQAVYKNHPYAKCALGDFKSINAINQQQLIDAYHDFITPHGAAIAIVGNLEKYDIQNILENTLGKWDGPKAPIITFPPLEPIVKEEINYHINRDQVVLSYAGNSISRLNPDFDKVLLFDQIFTGGVLGSMSSKLFQLREQTGLFYTIGGSLLAHADKQPGMVLVKTIVSLDRLSEAEKAIEKTINTATDTITDEELEQSKNALSNMLTQNFESNRQIASTFLFLDNYELPDDYFDTRALTLQKITKQEIQEASKKLLSTDKLIRLRVGRV